VTRDSRRGPVTRLRDRWRWYARSAVHEVSDIDLLDRWRAGDTAAGEALFKRHFDSVYGFFETKCPGDADELTQSTFLACVSSKDRFRKEASFRTYLFTIARHELYRLLRTRHRRDAKLDFELSSIAEIISTPGTRLARNQEHARLVELLQQLPLEQQSLLELHYREDVDIAALAEIFEVSTQVIRTRLSRARKALREKLEKLVKVEVAELETRDDWAGRLARG
jgi:RNA polymerase sigma factor (sigma-70 family)